MDDGGEEVGEPSKRIVATKMDGCVDIGLVVAEACCHLFLVEFALGRRVSRGESSNRCFLFLFAEQLGGLRRVGEQEVNKRATIMVGAPSKLLVRDNR